MIIKIKDSTANSVFFLETAYFNSRQCKFFINIFPLFLVHNDTIHKYISYLKMLNSLIKKKMTFVNHDKFRNKYDIRVSDSVMHFHFEKI